VAEILKYLLSLLETSSKLPNHPNHEQNTPLHWTALNHHLTCLQLLVSAGADPSLVNKAGYDAVFEAERAIPAQEQGEEGEVNGEGNGEGKGKVGKVVDEKTERGSPCVEFLLGCMEGKGLERGLRGGAVENEGEVEEEDKNEGSEDLEIGVDEAKEGVVGMKI
jgi:uncharacterized protein